MYQWQQIKENRLRGMGIKELARRFKLSKNTIRKYLRTEGAPCMKKRLYSNCVEQFKDDIVEMLEKEMIGTRIFNELKLKGFEGSQSSVDRYLQKIRKTSDLGWKQSTRFETEAGKQMQYDWKEWELQIGESTQKIYIHSLILSFSRKKFYVASLGITTADILQAIYEGITYFGGFAQELLIDNPKQMVLSHRKNGVIRYNDSFLKFCGLFGIIPNPCENYRPQTKGKVERPFLYLQEHLLKGLQVSNWGDLVARLKAFTTKVNSNYHSGIETTPDIRFQVEHPLLKPIPKVEPSAWRMMEIRKVSRDGYISLDAQFYPLPMNLCGKQVLVESIFGKSYQVRHAGSLICELERRTTGPVRISHPEHVIINTRYGDSKHRKRAVTVVEFIRLFGASGEIFFEGLRAAQRENLYFHLSEILSLTQFYQVSDMTAVFEEAILMDSFHKNTVKRLLVAKPLKIPVPTTRIAVLAPSASISRSLSEYKAVAHV